MLVLLQAPLNEIEIVSNLKLILILSKISLISNGTDNFAREQRWTLTAPLAIILPRSIFSMLTPLQVFPPTHRARLGRFHFQKFCQILLPGFQ